MNNNLFVLTGIVISLSIFSLIYIFSSFCYDILANRISMRWRILKYIPFNAYEMNFDNIDEIRFFEFRKDMPHGALIWGNLFVRKGVIIQLKKGFFKRMYITPEEPKLFMEKVKDKLVNKSDEAAQLSE